MTKRKFTMGHFWPKKINFHFGYETMHIKQDRITMAKLKYAKGRVHDVSSALAIGKNVSSTFKKLTTAWTWLWRLCLLFSPRSPKPHQMKKMLTFRTFLFRNCLQNLHIFIFVLESPHQMKKILTFRTILFRNCLQISQFFIFVLKSRKKRLGSGGFRD